MQRLGSEDKKQLFCQRRRREGKRGGSAHPLLLQNHRCAGGSTKGGDRIEEAHGALLGGFAKLLQIAREEGISSNPRISDFDRIGFVDLED